MPDLKDLAGKNQLDQLEPSFLWEMGLVATHGNMKYKQPKNWQEGTRPTYIAAILRHLLRYASGEVYDQETGLHHMAHLANSAMFLHWFDEAGQLSDRTCLCGHCQKAT